MIRIYSKKRKLINIDDLLINPNQVRKSGKLPVCGSKHNSTQKSGFG